MGHDVMGKMSWAQCSGQRGGGAQCWNTLDYVLKISYTIYREMDKIWTMPGQCMDHWWTMYGPFMDHLWTQFV